jgi:hypothetical protein
MTNPQLNLPSWCCRTAQTKACAAGTTSLFSAAAIRKCWHCRSKLSPNFVTAAWTGPECRCLTAVLLLLLRLLPG